MDLLHSKKEWLCVPKMESSQRHITEHKQASCRQLIQHDNIYKLYIFIDPCIYSHFQKTPDKVSLSLSLTHTHTNSLSKHQHSYHNCVSLLTVYICWSGKRMTWVRQEGGIFVKVTPFICFDTNMYVYEYVYAFPKLEKNQVLLFHWEQKYILETFQMYSCQIRLSSYFQTNIDVFC